MTRGSYLNSASPAERKRASVRHTGRAVRGARCSSAARGIKVRKFQSSLTVRRRCAFLCVPPASSLRAPCLSSGGKSGRLHAVARADARTMMRPERRASQPVHVRGLAMLYSGGTRRRNRRTVRVRCSRARRSF